MALFKILKGSSNNLGNQAYREGYCYVTTDEHKLYIDSTSSKEGRFPLNAQQADIALALAVDAGNSIQPVYFQGGVPVSTTYTLAKSVPSDAKFTDTNTWRGIQNNLTSTSTTDSLSAYQGKLLNDALANKMSANVANFELNANGSLKKYGGFIDFHYHNASGQPTNANGTTVTSTPDYTSRIIEDSPGTINVNGAKFKSGVITGTLNGTATKVSNTLTIGGKTFNGSSTVTISASDLGLASAMLYLGTTTTSISDGSTTNPITINSASKTVTAGNVVLYGNREFVWTGSAWEELGAEGSYKVVQTAVADPAASGTSNTFISNISQDANGKITISKKTVAVANKAPTLSWGDTSTIGSVAGTNLSVTMPSNPNTDQKTTSTAYTGTKNLYLIGADAQYDYGVTTYSRADTYISYDSNTKAYPLYNRGAKVLVDGESHARSDTNNGGGTSTYYGHVKLNDSYTNVSSASSSVAATPKAVYEAAQRSVSANSTGKIYLIGATEQTWTPSYTYSNSNIYANNNGKLYASQFIGGANTSWIYSRDYAALKTTAYASESITPAITQAVSSGYWSQGVLNDDMYWGYTTNTNYNNGTNTANSTVHITTAGKLYGAVWNDYAEYRDQKEDIKPGYCVASTDDGKVYKTTEKFQACDGIVSDTFGFAIGETDICKTPLAVAGRVLAYCEGDRHNYHAGDTVCAGPGGRVVKMTREEIREWPDRIVGIVSEIPEYELWGNEGSEVQVDGRIWIKTK